VKFLVDANLSSVVVDGLNESGFEAVHVGEVGLLSADDAEIFDYAEEEAFVVVTADSDFAMLLALSRASSPSVVQLRGVADQRSDVHLQLLLDQLPALVEPLESGAVASVSPDRVRVRDLPIER